MLAICLLLWNRVTCWHSLCSCHHTRLSVSLFIRWWCMDNEISWLRGWVSQWRPPHSEVRMQLMLIKWWFFGWSTWVWFLIDEFYFFATTFRASFEAISILSSRNQTAAKWKFLNRCNMCRWYCFLCLFWHLNTQFYIFYITDKATVLIRMTVELNSCPVFSLRKKSYKDL